eukprot:m.421598 g.421598  ORF g.421598 m.421598 type:complete len:118 (-) comp56647_c0_seq16:697-1050(-)
MFAQVQDDLAQLLEAVNSSNLGECQRIVHKWGIDIVTTPGQFSRAAYTALHWMARDNRLDILEWVLLQGVNCDLQTSLLGFATILERLHCAAPRRPSWAHRLRATAGGLWGRHCCGR